MRHKLGSVTTVTSRGGGFVVVRERGFDVERAVGARK